LASRRMARIQKGDGGKLRRGSGTFE